MSARKLLAVLLTTGVLGACSALGGCSQTGANTQVMVVVDGEAGVRGVTRLVSVRVYGGPHGADQDSLALVGSYPIAVPDTRWPLVIALAPLDRDPTRIYRVEAAAYDVGMLTDSAVPVATVRAISGYVPGQTVLLRLLLQDSCIGHECTDIQTTCDHGMCVSAVVDPTTLPAFGDAGEPDATALLDAGLDAPVRSDAALDSAVDGGAIDGGPTGCDGCDDGMPCTLDRCDTALNRCVHEVACDDSIDCTADTCDGAGTCQHVSMDALCTGGTDCTVGHCDVPMGRCVYVADETRCDDGLPCTADTCGATGCAHAPLTGPSCADALFCNGAETCNAGACTSPGDPCPGVSVCDEGMGACTGCATDSDCPADTAVDSACDYADSCDETAMLTRTLTTYTCGSGGHCDASVTSSPVACTRETDTMPCAGGSCGGYTCSGFTGTCDSTGVLTRTCVVNTCLAGICNGVPMMETGSACMRTTEGVSCGSLTCGAPYCSYADVCVEGGASVHDCTQPRCASDACSAAMFTEPSVGVSCGRTTSGMICGTCLSCAGGSCSMPSCDAGADAGMDAGIDAGGDAGDDAGDDAGGDARGDAAMSVDSGTDSGMLVTMPDGGP
jgi:hypothetical protein